VAEEVKDTTGSSLLSETDASESDEEDSDDEDERDESINEVSGEEPSLNVEEKELFHQMMEAGVFYGRSKSKTNPLLKKFILTTRSGFEVIDLQKAIEHLKRAGDVLKNVIANNGVILFVGTSPACKNIIKETAEKLESPYVTERWLGGTLTNFKTISARISYFKKLKEDKSAGRLIKYTKKEQLEKDKELLKLERLFGGIETLDKLPSMIFIADLSQNQYAAKEAKQKKIPVIGFLNTDTDPTLVDYPIPGNDRSSASVVLLMKFLEEAALEGKKEALLKKEEPKEAKTDGEEASK